MLENRKFIEKVREEIRNLQKEGKQSRDSDPFKDLLYLPFSEFKKRSIALQIYSDVLGCKIWLCSNEEMATQVKEDDPDAVTYTVDELRELIRLNPTPEDLKRIHEAKSVFSGSRIVDSQL